MQRDLREFSERLGYAFRAPGLLQAALTHGSARGDGGGHGTLGITACQRLEFLGDAGLGLAVGELLFRRLPQASEGELTRLRDRYVNNAHLAAVARSLGMGPCLRLGRSDRGLRDSDRILADALEAVLGAVYLDGGLPVLAETVARHVVPPGPASAALADGQSGKTELQEWLQSRGLDVPEYTVVSEDGPSHSRTYRIEARCGPVSAVGVASRKKTAEQRAAAAVLRKLAAADGARGLPPGQAREACR